MKPRAWIGGAALALAALVAYRILRAASEGWDFETFYAAALAWRQGLDPYDLGALSAVLGRPVELPFLYPPITLLLFLPWTLLPLAAAKVAWLTLLVVLAASLLALWHRRFLSGVPGLLLAAFALLAFDAPLLWCLRSGNVEPLVQVLLWAGFAFYAMDRRGIFAVLMVLAAVFKLQPIVFLLLLLVPGRQGRGHPGLALAALAGFVALTLVPVGTRSYWGSAFLGPPMERPGPPVNSSLLAVIDALLGPWSGSPEGTLVALALWGLAAALLVFLGRRALRDAWRRRDPGWTVVVATLLYGLIAPRMIVYSYLLMAVPALEIGRRVFRTRRARGLAIAAGSAQGLVQWLQSDAGWGVAGHLPWLMVLILWLAWAGQAGEPAGDRAEAKSCRVHDDSR